MTALRGGGGGPSTATSQGARAPPTHIFEKDQGTTSATTDQYTTTAFPQETMVRSWLCVF